MFGSGKAHYHPLYVENLVDAFELAAESSNGDGEAYLIGDEHHYAIKELVQAIGNTLDVDLNVRHMPFWPLWASALICEALYKPLRSEPPLFRRRVDWFRQYRAFSIEKARQDLGYQPKVGIDEGLYRTAEW